MNFHLSPVSRRAARINDSKTPAQLKVHRLLEPALHNPRLGREPHSLWMGHAGSWGARLTQGPGHAFLGLCTCGTVTLVQLQPALVPMPVPPTSQCLGEQGRAPHVNCASRRNPFPRPVAAATFPNTPCPQKPAQHPRGQGLSGHQPPPTQGFHLCSHQPGFRTSSPTPLLLLG